MAREIWIDLGLKYAASSTPLRSAPLISRTYPPSERIHFPSTLRTGSGTAGALFGVDASVVPGGAVTVSGASCRHELKPAKAISPAHSAAVIRPDLKGVFRQAPWKNARRLGKRDMRQCGDS